MPQSRSRSSRASSSQKSPRTSQSTTSNDTDTKSNSSPKVPTNIHPKSKRSILAHKVKLQTSHTTAGAADDGSEGSLGEGDTEEPPDGNESQDEDETPAVFAPSCDTRQNYTIHKTGRPMKRTEPPDVQRVSETASHPSSYDSSSDDDDYAAVDDISDSEDEAEESVERHEEEMIISSYRDITLDDLPTLTRTATEGYTSNWSSFGVGEGLFLASESFLGEPIEGFTDEDMPSQANFDIGSSRHVRFADEIDHSSSNSSSSDSESNTFPDTFLQQDQLPPQLQSAIEHDSADENQSLSENEWDLRQNGLDEYEHYGLANDDDSPESEVSSYDSEGETTDEDLPPTTVAPLRSLLRADSSDSFASHRRFPRRHSLNGPLSPNRARRAIARTAGPRMGSWIADPDKNVAYLGPTGKLMYIRTARRSGMFMGGSQTMYGMLDESENDTSTPTSPMLSSDVNLMMSGLFHWGPGNEQTRGGQVTGPPEAFYPFQSIGANGMTSDDLDADEDMDDIMLNVADFIDFGDDSSSDEYEGAEGEMLTDRKGKAIEATPNDPSEESHLNHLDGGNVTAFRSNTDLFNSFLKRPQHREFNPHSSPGTPSAVRCGRQSELHSPIAPRRKRKTESPLPGESNVGNTVQRTFARPHKRSKSSIQ